MTLANQRVALIFMPFGQANFRDDRLKRDCPYFYARKPGGIMAYGCFQNDWEPADWKSRSETEKPPQGLRLPRGRGS